MPSEKNRDFFSMTFPNPSALTEQDIPDDEAGSIVNRTDRFERFHTETSRILMNKLYPSDLSEDNLPDTLMPRSTSTSGGLRPRIDITGTLPKRTSNDPENKAGERLRQSYLAYLKKNPEKIPFAVEKKDPVYRPYVLPQRGSSEMHEFFRQEQRSDDEEQQKWEDEIRERARFINAENKYFERLTKSERKRILDGGKLTIKPPLSEKEIKDAAAVAVVRQRLKRRKIHIPENEFFLYFNAWKTAEKTRKPSIYTFENTDGFRIVYPENYFPDPDERLDLSLLTPSQKAKAEEQFRKYKITTGVISRSRRPEAFNR